MHILNEVTNIGGVPVRQARKYAVGDGFEFIGSFQIVPDAGDASASIDASLIASWFDIIESFDITFDSSPANAGGNAKYDRANKRIRFFNSGNVNAPEAQVVDGIGNLAAYLASISNSIITIRARGI